jgi:phosphatidylserine decarboxylase
MVVVRMLNASRPRLFWKNNRNRLTSNPARRWIPHRWIACGLLTAGAWVYVSYAKAKYAPFGEERFAGSVVETMVTWFPNAFASRIFGEVASSEVLPQFVHGAIIRCYGGSDEDATRYPTFSKYFERTFAVGSRPLAGADVVSPCDATVMSVMDVTQLDRPFIVQVKGHYYAVDNFLRAQLPPVPRGYRRYSTVMQLGMSDVHRVHAPSMYDVEYSNHVPGTLLPLSEASGRWLPQVYLTNERVTLMGRAARRPLTFDPERDDRPVLAVALIGGLFEGRIRMDFDERIVTNLETTMMTAVRRQYKNCQLEKGSPLGHFEAGSAVVMVFDSKDAPNVEPGQRVRMGQAIVGANA